MSQVQVLSARLYKIISRKELEHFVSEVVLFVYEKCKQKINTPQMLMENDNGTQLPFISQNSKVG